MLGEARVTSHEMAAVPGAGATITTVPLPWLGWDDPRYGHIHTKQNGNQCVMMRDVHECAQCGVHFIILESPNLSVLVILVLP